MPSHDTPPKRTDRIDRLIREGQGDEARKLIESLAKGKLPRAEAATVASLAERVSLPLVGVRLLNPYVRPERRSPVVPTDEEKAVYAYCLTRIGAADEALALLADIPRQGFPRASFYLAAAHMHRWEYEEALPLLSGYVKARSLTEYQRLVGRVNLAAVLVYLREFRKASYLLHDLLYDTGVRNLTLLHGNCLELAAYNCLVHGKLAEAERFLDRSEALLERTASRERLYLKKWKAILALVRSKGDAASLAALAEVRREARAKADYETLRDCDRFEAVVRSDAKLLAHVYFGTPYESFRKRLLFDFGAKASLPAVYDWAPVQSGKRAPVLDPARGETDGGAKLKPGGTLHRLAVILTSDFYRPFRIASLFGALFPDEIYNPASSPPRVHQAIKLLRKWLADARLPLDIIGESGFYRVEASGPCLIRVTLARPTDKNAVQLTKLREKWPGGAFAVREAAAHLGVSERTALRILENGMKSGSVTRSGTRARARYQFAA